MKYIMVSILSVVVIFRQTLNMVTAIETAAKAINDLCYGEKDCKDCPYSMLGQFTKPDLSDTCMFNLLNALRYESRKLLTLKELNGGNK
jgi:hypothetical protein